MNFLRLSTSPKTKPAAPQGAPPIPDGFRIPELIAFTLFGVTAMVIMEFQPVVTSVGVTVLGVCWYNQLKRHRLYNRIGWYKQREITTPELPFTMYGTEERIIFGPDAITLTPYPYTKRGRSCIIPYEHVTNVYTQCNGTCLTGIAIELSPESHETMTKHIYIAGIALRWSKSKKSWLYIRDGTDGEKTRTALAILRAKAPHATFSGPRWIEEGWVPRQGFSLPNSDGGGGGP